MATGHTYWSFMARVALGASCGPIDHLDHKRPVVFRHQKRPGREPAAAVRGSRPHVPGQRPVCPRRMRMGLPDIHASLRKPVPSHVKNSPVLQFPREQGLLDHPLNSLRRRARYETQTQARLRQPSSGRRARSSVPSRSRPRRWNANVNIPIDTTASMGPRPSGPPEAQIPTTAATSAHLAKPLLDRRTACQVSSAVRASHTRARPW